MKDYSAREKAMFIMTLEAFLGWKKVALPVGTNDEKLAKIETIANGTETPQAKVDESIRTTLRRLLKHGQ